MTIPTTVRWIAIAVIGLLVALAVAVLASRLTSQRIGLASEPLEAGKALAPAGPGPASTANDRHVETSTATTTATQATTTSSATTTDAISTTSGDDSGGDDSGEDDD